MKPSQATTSCLGILGGGQLGMMLAREVRRMGCTTIVWDPDPAAPAIRESPMTVVRPFGEPDGMRLFSEKSDVATYEMEHLPAKFVEDLEAGVAVVPGSRMLRICQDRWREKETLAGAGLPVAPYRKARSRTEVLTAVGALGTPVVVKTAHAGYDGKGQAVLRTGEDLRAYLGTLEEQTPPLVVERLVDLAGECSVIVARSGSGEMVTFPVALNVHRKNILHSTRLPAGMEPRLALDAEALATGVAEALKFTGVLCIEMFIESDGRLLVNELAPRPHNSGHFSIEACDLSQFEALARVALGLPVPTPRLLSPCAMVNLVGVDMDEELRRELLAIPGTRLHWYGKNRIAPGRKMGHVTVVGPDVPSLDAIVERLEASILRAGERTTYGTIERAPLPEKRRSEETTA